jgi:hypothetical protein
MVAALYLDVTARAAVAGTRDPGNANPNHNRSA